MNRTALFLTSAGALALCALIVGVPSTSTPPPPRPVVTPDPMPPKPAQASNGSISMIGRLSHPYVTAGRSDVFVTVDLQGAEVKGAERAPVNLALVIDRSGSMSGEKLANAKRAARHLVQQLRDADRLAIVHYGSDVRALHGMAATESNKARMLSYIDRIWDEGGTNIGAGLNSGRAQLSTTLEQYKVNRIIFISDGQPTEGMTNESDLAQLTRNIRAQGISVSSIGVGTDFNEDLMQQIAEFGAGSYGYLRDASMLATIFQRDLQQAGTTIAKNVGLSFELPEGVELAEVLGYRSTQSGRTVHVPLTDFSAGQIEKVVARLTVNASSNGNAFDVTSLRLDYQDLLANAPISSKVQLAAMVTDREELVLARRDKDAAVTAARAQAGKNLKLAADAIAKGDTGVAQQYIQENKFLYKEAEEVAGPAAMADDIREADELSAIAAQPAAPEERAHTAKKAKASALKSMGRVSSTY